MARATRSVNAHVDTLPQKKFIFDWTMNAGHVFTVISFMLFAATILWQQSNFQATVTAEQKIGQAARDKYIPKIDELERMQGIDNNRFDNIGDALREVRTAVRDLNTATSDLRVKLASLEAVLESKKIIVQDN